MKVETLNNGTPSLPLYISHLVSSSPKFALSSSSSPHEIARDLATELLHARGIDMSEIDFVISLTQTPDTNNPGLVSHFLHSMGRSGIGGLELRQCGSGFSFGTDLASALIRAGKYKRILIISTEILTRFYTGRELPDTLSPNQRAFIAYASDGAAAWLVEGQNALGEFSPAFRIGHSLIATYGEYSDAVFCAVPSSSQYPLRITKADLEQGREIPAIDVGRFHEFLSKRMEPELAKFLTQSTEFGVPEQVLLANVPQPIFEGLKSEQGALTQAIAGSLSSEPTFRSSAAVPVHLFELWREARLKPTTSLVTAAIGAGMSVGFTYLRCERRLL